MEEQIRLALVSDNVLFRDSLGGLLELEPDFELVSACSASDDALAMLGVANVDMILLELADRTDNFIHSAGEAGYQGKVLVVTDEIDTARAAGVLSSGASGIFLKCEPAKRLLLAIRLVASGGAWVDLKVVRQIAESFCQHEGPRFHWPTKRQELVIRGILDGLKNREIGKKIGASEATVKATIQSLFSKVGVRTRSQLVRAVLEGAIPSTAADRLTAEILPPAGNQRNNLSIGG